MTYTRISSGSPYEKPIGFSRAIKTDKMLYISGTGPVGKDGKTHAPDNAYEQSKRCLQIIQQAILDAGCTVNQVVRTRMYITDRSVWKDVTRAHGEIFSDIRPASTLVVVAGLIEDDWLVEIEADCEI